MTKYREIIRLSGLGLSQTNIALSCNASKTTVNKVLKAAREQNLSWPLDPKLADPVLVKLLFPDLKAKPTTSKRMPDYEHIRKELLRNGVNKKLLWTEYLEECRLAGDEPLMYSQFCYYIQQDEQKRRATMHINRRPAEQVEVDWAGAPAHIIDPDTGETLFALEDDIRKKCQTFAEIKEARQKKEKPVLEGFLSWVDQQRPVKGSRLDKALTYIRNRRSYMETYLEDGRCSFSNNASERSIKDFVIGRKNWLFSDTPAGADASAMTYTMVEMAKANGVNVYHYLTFLFENQPNSQMSDEELETLAPWNETVKAEIERRVNEAAIK